MMAAWDRTLAHYGRRSRAFIGFLQANLARIAIGWLVVVLALGAAKTAASLSPVNSPRDAFVLLVPYLLILAAPIAGYRLAALSFLGPAGSEQPRYRFAVIGRWRELPDGEAAAHPDFGPFGFMACLVGGMLLNVVFRTGEFFLAMPALTAQAPDWSLTLLAVMTLDLVTMNFFYMVCFAMALRHNPLFPRMLLYAWILDVGMQLLIAREVGALAGVPGGVAQALVQLLNGNVQKVLLSMAVWLPYLLLSDRVNVTYRHRVPRH